MKITQKENHIIVADEKDDVNNFADFLTRKAYEEHLQGKNVIVDISKYGNLNLKELLNFLEVSDKHRKSGHSFVLVNDAINIDPVPEELIVVPTLLEAGDVIQMEEIERDLGAF